MVTGIYFLLMGFINVFNVMRIQEEITNTSLCFRQILLNDARRSVLIRLRRI